MKKYEADKTSIQTFWPIVTDNLNSTTRIFQDVHSFFVSDTTEVYSIHLLKETILNIKFCTLKLLRKQISDNITSPHNT